MQFYVKPWAHQLDAINQCNDKDYFALLWDMGTGKTSTIINIIRTKINNEKKFLNTLIFTPLATVGNWRQEFLAHSRIADSQIYALNNSTKRQKQLKDAFQKRDMGLIIIINYEAITSEKIYNALHDIKWDILVCDEAHLLKDPKSKRSQKIALLSEKIKKRFLLTGTPILNSPQDIFWPWRILDQGKSFGKNFFVFRARYFYDRNASWASRDGYYPEWVPRPEAVDEIKKIISMNASRVMKKDCLDLPPYVVKRINVTLDKQQQVLYAQMEKSFIAWVDDQKESAIVAELALTKSLRLQQIVTGVLTTDDGKETILENIPRLQVVEDILKSVASEHKVIIWCTFRGNYKQLSNVCNKLNIKHTFLVGNQSGKDREEAMDQFRKDPETRVIIANRRAGGTGVNLVEASYSIVYSRDHSLALELQSEARNYRGGSHIHEKITRIDLCAVDTIDELIVNALTRKQEVADEVVKWIQKHKEHT